MTEVINETDYEIHEAELSALAVDDKDRHGVLFLSCVLFSARKPLKRQRKGINIPLAGRLIPW